MRTNTKLREGRTGKDLYRKARRAKREGALTTAAKFAIAVEGLASSWMGTSAAARGVQEAMTGLIKGTR